MLRELPYVDIAYVAGRAWKDQPGLATYLLAPGGDPKFAKRAARAVTTALQRQSIAELLEPTVCLILGVRLTQPNSTVVRDSAQSWFRLEVMSRVRHG